MTRRTLTAFARAAALFRALGDVERLKLLEILSQREVCVTELARGSGVTLSTASQRLRVLRSEGLVVHRREGQQIFYAIADQRIAELVRNALDHVSGLKDSRRSTGRSGAAPAPESRQERSLRPSVVAVNGPPTERTGRLPEASSGRPKTLRDRDLR